MVENTSNELILLIVLLFILVVSGYLLKNYFSCCIFYKIDYLYCKGLWVKCFLKR